MPNPPESQRAYLLITFDLRSQRMLSTDEVSSPFEGEFQEVDVDWGRFVSLIPQKAPAPPLPKDPPWKRTAIDEDESPKDPPWSRTPIDYEEEGTPPKV